jgi:hypothetical protein
MIVIFSNFQLKAALTEFKIPKMRVISDVPDSTSAEIEGVEIPNNVDYVRLNTSRFISFTYF